MLVRASLVSGSVIGLNVWHSNKVFAAEQSTSEQPVKKKIRPSEVSEWWLLRFGWLLLIGGCAGNAMKIFTMHAIPQHF